MRTIRSASEPEIIAVFLRGELDSPRYGDRIRDLLRDAELDESVLLAADLDDAEENARRARILEEHRGWLRRDGLFGGFPEEVDWSLVGLPPDEVLSIVYIDWEWWLDISGGTRRPSDAAARIHAGDVPEVNAAEDERIAARLRSADQPRELIIVSTPELSRLVALEGHVRLTAYALFPDYLPPELPMYLGASAAMGDWALF